MSESYETSSNRNHFPIIMQLVILALILGGIFSTFLMQTFTPEPAAPQIVTIPLTESRTPEAPTAFTVTNDELVAKAAYVYDINTGTMLYSQNETESLPLASITKLMTALVAYELVSENTTAAVPLNAIRQEGSSGFTAGEVLTLERLTEMSLISSSNDAAYTLAASVGSLLGERDATEQFVTAMNIRAEELGLSSLLFYNTTGLDVSATEAGAFGNAEDVSKLLAYILLEYPELIAPTTEVTARVYNTAGAYHDVENTNEILEQIPNLIGSKTGFTDLAGGNLTIAFDAGFDRPVVITVLGSTFSDRFTDVLTLVEATQAALGNI